MKAKLLIKLRKRFQLFNRNKEYKIIDSNNFDASEFANNGTEWMSKEKAIKTRRKLILEASKPYKVVKKLIKN